MRFENVVFPDSVGFRCIKCGFCCKNNPPDVNEEEQQKIESKGFKDFLETADETGDTSIRKKKDRSCLFFTKENTCAIEDIKPSICRLEPFDITGYDYKTNNIFLNITPFSALTCKGIFAGELQDPKETAKAAQTIIKNISEIMAKKSGLSVTDKKVALLTSKIIKHLNSK